MGTVTMRVLAFVAGLFVVSAAASLAGLAQGDESLALGPGAKILYPATVDDDGDMISDGEVLQLSPADGGLNTVGGAQTTTAEFIGIGPIEDGLLFNESGQVVITMSVQMAAGALVTVTAELFMGDTSLGSAEETQDALANAPTVYTLAFTPSTLEVPAAVTPRLVVTASSTQPQLSVGWDLPDCKIELPILSLLGAPTNTTANNTTDDKEGDDTPALGFVLIGAGVALAAWVTGRRRRF